LLVVPVPEIDDDNHVLLSSLDATVVQHGAEFNLGLHKYQGNNFSPNGHKYIREFDITVVPTTTYRVGGAVLKRETIFQAYEDRILVRYTLVDANAPTQLRLRPFLAFRSVRQFTHENSTASRAYSEVPGGIKTCMYKGYPDLFMQLSKKSNWVFMPDWYRGVEYPKEQERGYASNEDLYVPGYFEIEMKKGDSFVFAAGTKEIAPRTLQKLFEEEISYRTKRDSFWNMLVTAAHQFHNRIKGTGKTPDEDDRYLLAGYPWFKCRARDTFISLPGLTLSIGEQDYFELVMKTAERALREFMEEKPSTTKMAEVELPDVMLWAIWAIQQYSHYTDTKTCYARYGQLVKDIVKFIEDGKHPNLRLDSNGLVWSDGLNKAVTWMNSTANGHPVVPRTGYIVEFNALWFNALKFSAQMAADMGDPNTALELERKASLAQQSFIGTFLNEYGYLFDYVDPNIGQDWSVRPNMIFAVALDYSPLTPQQMKGVVDICTRELLTPKGLRSLSPKSGGYNPMYVGPQTQRDYAYHQGTAWPWLGGFYMEAMLKLYKRSRLSFIERQMVGYEDEMDYHAIGTISELFDGNPPFHGRGAMAFAMNVAEILRTQELLDKYNS
jgi:predicted glycogen debranching enzyme